MWASLLHFTARNEYPRTYLKPLAQRELVRAKWQSLQRRESGVSFLVILSNPEVILENGSYLWEAKIDQVAYG